MARMNYLSNYLEEKMGLPVELASVRNEGIKIAEERLLFPLGQDHSLEGGRAEA